MLDEIKKKRGRPPLSPEQKAERIAQRRAARNAYYKQTGYAAQKKYKQTHPEKCRSYSASARKKTYEPKLRLPIEQKDALAALLNRNGMSLTQLFVSLVFEKYGVDLSTPNE